MCPRDLSSSTKYRDPKQNDHDDDVNQHVPIQDVQESMASPRASLAAHIAWTQKDMAVDYSFV